jgi:hypothetical protein
MYGASIEKDVQHIAFEQQQLKRRLEMQRLLDDEQIDQRSRRSLVDIFGRFTPRLALRTPAGRSPVTPS